MPPRHQIPAPVTHFLGTEGAATPGSLGVATGVARDVLRKPESECPARRDQAGGTEFVNGALRASRARNSMHLGIRGEDHR